MYSPIDFIKELDQKMSGIFEGFALSFFSFQEEWLTTRAADPQHFYTKTVKAA